MDAKPVVAITGASSTIGQAVSAELKARGCQVIEYKRDSADPKLRFNLASPPQSLPMRLDALIHLAWDRVEDFDQSLSLNVEHLEPLLKSLAIDETKVVLLSSESASPNAGSVYGRLKFLLENEFLRIGGVIVRAGIVTGPENFGIFQRIHRLATIPLFCLHLSPDPNFRITDLKGLARCLADAACTDGFPRKVLANNGTVHTLSQISHQQRRDKLTLMHFHVRIRLLLTMLNLAKSIFTRLPLKIDSLYSLVGAENEVTGWQQFNTLTCQLGDRP